MVSRVIYDHLGVGFGIPFYWSLETRETSSLNGRVFVRSYGLILSLSVVIAVEDLS